MADASTIEFELARFEHLVETQRGHIVRVSGRWTTPDGGELPHPTLIAGQAGDAVRINPLPIPGQDPPRGDGTTVWLASYSIPKRLFEDGRAPACRLQPAPDVLVDLPALAVPASSEPLVAMPPRRTLTPLPGPEAQPAAPAIAPEPEPAAAAPQRSTKDSYLAAVRSHRRLVLLIVGVAILGSIIGMAVRAPTYRAASELLISPLPRGETMIQGLTQVQVGSDPAQTVETVAKLVRSEDVAQITARRLGSGWTARRVLSHIDVAPAGSSNVLAVRATASDPDRAARLADTFARAAVDLRDQRMRAQATTALKRTNDQLATLPDKTTDEAQTLQLQIAELERIRQAGDPTLELLRGAAVPRSPDGLPPIAILVLTALAGAVIAVAAAALLDLVNPARIDTEGEMLAVYPLPVLTRIPTLPRGRRTPDAPELREAFRTLQVQLELEEGRHQAIMVTSGSSGDGKTTTAVAFALELAATGREVILIDLDLRKSDLARRLDVQPQRGFEHVIAGSVPLADALAPVPGRDRVSLLTRVDEYNPVSLEAVADHLPDIVEGATSLADYVVLDSAPAGEISDALRFTRAVDDVLVVCRLGQTRRASFETLRDLLGRIGTTPSGAIVIGAGARGVRPGRYSFAETAGSAP